MLPQLSNLLLSILIILATVRFAHESQLHPVRRHAARTWQFERREADPKVGPRWVLFWNKWIAGESGPPAPVEVKGYNVLILTFLLVEGAWDQAKMWEQLTDAQRSSHKEEYAAHGIKLMVSAFGSTNTPTTSNVDPIACATTTMANWVLKHQLDGIDVDYEDLNAMSAGDGKAEAWLISYTHQLRDLLPANKGYLVTHSPVAPWFSPGRFGGGGYLMIDSKVGGLIDWYHIQFYNQGNTEYTDCNSLLFDSSTTWPSSSVFEISGSGVTLSKLIIGKPVTLSHASNGFMDPDQLASCIAIAKKQGWAGGAMVWQYPNADSTWIKTVRSGSWPVA